jgi:hypothetical protein
MRHLTPLLLVLVMGTFGCTAEKPDDTTTDPTLVDMSPDDVLDGTAYFTAGGIAINGDNNVEDCTSTLMDDGTELNYGQTGETLEIAVKTDGDMTITVKHGSPELVGCDNQFLHPSDGEDYMVPDSTVTLEDGQTSQVDTPMGVPYFQWNGQLDCYASWDGGDQAYEPSDFTNESTGMTCTDNDGELEIGGQILYFIEGQPFIEDSDGPVTNLVVNDSGLSLTWDMGTVIDIVCDVR